MNNQTYLEQSAKTDLSPEQYEQMLVRSADPIFQKLEHAAYGMVTEAAEFLDALKKYKYYGKPMNFGNLKEEIGDGKWYHALAMRTLGTTSEEVQETNIAKLIARYGDKFSEARALNRDLEKEQKILGS